MYNRVSTNTCWPGLKWQGMDWPETSSHHRAKGWGNSCEGETILHEPGSSAGDHSPHLTSHGWPTSHRGSRTPLPCLMRLWVRTSMNTDLPPRGHSAAICRWPYVGCNQRGGRQPCHRGPLTDPRHLGVSRNEDTTLQKDDKDGWYRDQNNNLILPATLVITCVNTCIQLHTWEKERP